jgi:hypothetical protein
MKKFFFRNIKKLGCGIGALSYTNHNCKISLKILVFSTAPSCLNIGKKYKIFPWLVGGTKSIFFENRNAWVWKSCSMGIQNKRCNYFFDISLSTNAIKSSRIFRSRFLYIQICIHHSYVHLYGKQTRTGFKFSIHNRTAY